MPVSQKQQLLYRLDFIDRHLAESNEHIAKMESLVEEAERNGLDQTQPKKVLANFRRSVAMIEAERKQVLAELDESA